MSQVLSVLYSNTNRKALPYTSQLMWYSRELFIYLKTKEEIHTQAQETKAIETQQEALEIVK